MTPKKLSQVFSIISCLAKNGATPEEISWLRREIDQYIRGLFGNRIDQ